MSNEIKPVAWMTMDGFDVAHPDDATDEYTEPLYDQSAIDRLTAERDAASRDYEAVREYGDSQRILAFEGERRIRYLESQLAEYKADAERWRWARRQNNREQAVLSLTRYMNADAAIDAARKESE